MVRYWRLLHNTLFLKFDNFDRIQKCVFSQFHEKSKDHEIIQTSIATVMEPKPPIATLSERASTKIRTIADVMATIGIKPASNFVMKGSMTIGSKQMTKTRGRPRNWGFDGKMPSSTTTLLKVLSHSIDSFV